MLVEHMASSDERICIENHRCLLFFLPVHNDSRFDFVVHVVVHSVVVDRDEFAFQLLVQLNVANVYDVDIPNRPKTNSSNMIESVKLNKSSSCHVPASFVAYHPI
jgi:hypothetical protein